MSLSWMCSSFRNLFLYPSTARFIGFLVLEASIELILVEYFDNDDRIYHNYVCTNEKDWDYFVVGRLLSFLVIPSQNYTHSKMNLEDIIRFNCTLLGILSGYHTRTLSFSCPPIKPKHCLSLEQSATHPPTLVLVTGKA